MRKAIANERRRNGTARDNTVRWLRSQGRPCWICGLPIDYGLPGLHPLSFECDELDPVSRGGSPIDRANVDAAHRCCNNWRKAKSVCEVVAKRDELLSRGVSWREPGEFVECMKALGRGAGPITMKKGKAQGRITTDW